jgi:hypothetical protein
MNLDFPNRKFLSGIGKNAPAKAGRKVQILEKTFKEKYLAGEVEFEEIDDYSQEWGLHDDSMTLREYLGLNAEEEDAWVSISDEALKELLDKQRR